MNKEQLLSDFSPFVDIGAVAPKVTREKEKYIVRFFRDGREIKITIDEKTGAVKSVWGQAAARNHHSIPALLSSDIFANLKRWAEIQAEFLKRELNERKRTIPISARDEGGVVVNDASAIDALIGARQRSEGAAEVVIIDGPAGIGKTHLISELALLRAEAYKETARPLILHVKSRGRILSNLDDLMAFSLQTIRSTVTYDQVPVLARHGLIIAAIDGFDELGDPNGYEMAWAQLSEMIAAIRGLGTIILAGRDTFIGRDRVMKDVSSLREGVDLVRGITLQSPTPEQAKKWLLAHDGWGEPSFTLPSIAVLLEEGSFALRPVFLKLLAEGVKPKDIKGMHERYLTPLLLRGIIGREAKLFGKPVQAIMPSEEIENFLDNFLLEVAREMADMQSESLDGSSLAWIAEAALGDGYANDIVGLVKNRASVVALLVNDDRPGYKTFVHTYLQNYYLGRVTIEALGRGEVPKFIRRNILGPEFLGTFVDVASEYGSSKPKIFHNFFARTQSLAQNYTSIDRGARNLGALLLASLPNLTKEENVLLNAVQIDDAIVRGTAGPAEFSSVVVNQLDCRSADLSAVVFDDCSITNLIADNGSIFSKSFPNPTVLISSTGEQITEAGKISDWINVRGRVGGSSRNSVVSDKIRVHGIYSLLGRICRIRQYWLRSGDDDIHSERIFRDPNWVVLSKLLTAHGFLRMEKRNASGRSSNFYHIRQPERLLSESEEDEEVVGFFRDLDGQI